MSFFIFNDEHSVPEDQFNDIIKEIFPGATIKTATGGNYDFEIELDDTSEVLVESEVIVIDGGINEATAIFDAVKTQLTQNSNWQMFDDSLEKFVET